MVFIFSYNRKEWLINTIEELKEFNPIVLDDGSDFEIDYPNFIKYPHEGKKGFWKKWKDALYLASQSNDEFFMFVPDDYSKYELKTILRIHEAFKTKPYIHHIAVDNRKFCWSNQQDIPLSSVRFRSYFVDCQFFCNKLALDKMGYDFKPIPQEWWDLESKHGSLSSGVGKQLSFNINKAGIPIYKLHRSLAYHEGHTDSQMHPELRKKQPLKSL
jgi:hypothetical protein